jgi:MFS transporter, MHS family, shikimate and dehydroshikimate transport protein
MEPTAWTGDKIEVSTPDQRRTLRRTIVGSSIGNIIEQYAFALYGAVSALVFGPLFFPSHSATASLMDAFSTYAVGFVARPLGALVAGHFGDLQGRRNVLVATLVIVGLSTFAIGLLPPYAAIGVWAPVFLILLRFIQGFSFGGEYGGAILMVAERAPRARRGFYTGFVPASSAIGVLLSTVALLLLTLFPKESFLSWGWRVPFLLSIVLVVTGLAIRRHVEETPAFENVRNKEAMTAEEVKRRPLREAVKYDGREILLAGGLTTGSSTVNYVLLTWLLSYISTNLGLSSRVGLIGLVFTMCAYTLSNFVSSAVSDSVGRRSVIMAGGLALAAFAIPMFWIIDTKVSGLIWLAMAVTALFGGMVYGPLGLLASELFATRFRYSGASMSFQLGQTLGGGFSPLIATALFAATGVSWVVGLYMLAGGMVVVGCVYALTETAKRDIAA